MRPRRNAFVVQHLSILQPKLGVGPQRRFIEGFCGRHDEELRLATSNYQKRFHQLAYLARLLGELIVHGGDGHVPVSSVLECLDLRRLAARRGLGAFEKQVVVALGVEPRVQIDQIDAFRGNRIPEHVEVVAVIELVHGERTLPGQCPKPVTMIRPHFRLGLRADEPETRFLPPRSISASQKILFQLAGALRRPKKSFFDPPKR